MPRDRTPVMVPVDQHGQPLEPAPAFPIPQEGQDDRETENWAYEAGLWIGTFTAIQSLERAQRIALAFIAGLRRQPEPKPEEVADVGEGA